GDAEQAVEAELVLDGQAEGGEGRPKRGDRAGGRAAQAVVRGEQAAGEGGGRGPVPVPQNWVEGRGGRGGNRPARKAPDRRREGGGGRRGAAPGAGTPELGRGRGRARWERSGPQGPRPAGGKGGGAGSGAGGERAWGASWASPRRPRGGDHVRRFRAPAGRGR